MLSQDQNWGEIASELSVDVNQLQTPYGKLVSKIMQQKNKRNGHKYVDHGGKHNVVRNPADLLDETGHQVGRQSPESKGIISHNKH